MELKSVILPVVGKGLASLLLAVGCISCNTIFTDQEDCPRGISLRFIYDYNMEHANSFHQKVHCATVYVFDDNGGLVTKLEETGEALASEDWRMRFSLEPGDYTLLAYGGLACEKSSFTPVSMDTKTTGNSIDGHAVTLNHDDFVSDEALHDLYFGNLGQPLQISVREDDYQEETVRMLKNTNNIRVILQQMNGEQISADEFTFTITDDNSCTDALNEVVPQGMMTYLPWTKGQTVVGVAEDGETPVTAAYAEFSTGRLTEKTEPRLVIRSVAKDKDIINIPLNTYLLLLKSDLYGNMPAQEFLDRESEWTLAFFLDSNNRWINTNIIVNGWTVRINEDEL